MTLAENHPFGSINSTLEIFVLHHLGKIWSPKWTPKRQDTRMYLEDFGISRAIKAIQKKQKWLIL